MNEKKRKEFSQKLLLKGIESWVCFKHLPFDKSCDTRGDFKCHYDIVINDVPGKSAAMMSELVGDGECCSLLLTAVKNSVSRLKKGKGHPFYFDEVKVFTPKEFCDIVLTSLKTVQDDSDFDCGNPLLELVTYANGRSL